MEISLGSFGNHLPTRDLVYINSVEQQVLERREPGVRGPVVRPRHERPSSAEQGPGSGQWGSESAS